MESKKKSETIKDEKNSEIIKLNVGGRKFTTTRATLITQPNSMLAAMFNSHTAHIDKEYYFIDRNGDLFAHVLDYLRTGSLSATITGGLLQDVEREAKYYQIDIFGPTSVAKRPRTDGAYHSRKTDSVLWFESDQTVLMITDETKRVQYSFSAFGMVTLGSFSLTGVVSGDRLVFNDDSFDFYAHGYPLNNVPYSDIYFFNEETVTRKNDDGDVVCKSKAERYVTQAGVHVLCEYKTEEHLVSYLFYCFGRLCVRQRGLVFVPITAEQLAK